MGLKEELSSERSAANGGGTEARIAYRVAALHLVLAHDAGELGEDCEAQAPSHDVGGARVFEIHV